MAKKRHTTDRALPDPEPRSAAPRKLLADLREMIEAARSGVAQAVNSAQVLPYWQVGDRLRTDVGPPFWPWRPSSGTRRRTRGTSWHTAVSAHCRAWRTRP